MQPIQFKTEFSSIPDFIHHFKEQDELPLEANQSLVIRNFSLLQDKTNVYEKDEKMPEGMHQVIFILNKMVQPLAKTFSIKPSKSKIVEYDSSIGKDEWSLKFTEHTILKANRGAVFTRVTDLFRLMVASSIFQVKLNPNQSLVIQGLNKEEAAFTSFSQEAYNALIAKRVGMGFTCSLKANNLDFEVIKVHFDDPSTAVDSCKITAQELVLTLEDSFIFLSSRDFRKRLQLTGEIKVVKELELHDPNLVYLYEIYQTQFKDKISFIGFILNHMVLPLGKIVSFDYKDGGLDWKIKDNCLKISTDQPFSIRLAEAKYITTNLKNLANDLINERQSNFFIEPSQTLMIYDVEEEKIKDWISSNDQSRINLGLRKLLLKCHPIGFSWKMSFTNDLFCQSTTKNEQGKCYLLLSSSQGISLSLERASGDVLILSLIQSSNPILKDELLEHKNEAYLFLIFKALFYYSCQDFRHFRTNELPNFFKETTLSGLQKLIYEDEEFEKSLETILEGPERQELDTIFLFSSQEFDQLNLDKISSPHVNYLIKKIRNLAYEELYGSLFISQYLPAALKYLNSESKQ